MEEVLDESSTPSEPEPEEEFATADDDDGGSSSTPVESVDDSVVTESSSQHGEEVMGEYDADDGIPPVQLHADVDQEDEEMLAEAETETGTEVLAADDQQDEAGADSNNVDTPQPEADEDVAESEEEEEDKKLEAMESEVQPEAEAEAETIVAKEDEESLASTTTDDAAAKPVVDAEPEIPSDTNAMQVAKSDDDKDVSTPTPPAAEDDAAVVAQVVMQPPSPQCDPKQQRVDDEGESSRTVPHMDVDVAVSSPEVPTQIQSSAGGVAAVMYGVSEANVVAVEQVAAVIDAAPVEAASPVSAADADAIHDSVNDRRSSGAPAAGSIAVANEEEEDDDEEDVFSVMLQARKSKALATKPRSTGKKFQFRLKSVSSEIEVSTDADAAVTKIKDHVPRLFQTPIDCGAYEYDPSTDLDFCGEADEEGDPDYESFKEEQRSRKIRRATQEFEDYKADKKREMDIYTQQKTKDNANRLSRYVLKIRTDMMTKQELQRNQVNGHAVIEYSFFVFHRQYWVRWLISSCFNSFWILTVERWSPLQQRYIRITML